MQKTEEFTAGDKEVELLSVSWEKAKQPRGHCRDVNRGFPPGRAAVHLHVGSAAIAEPRT
nr:hypothetical protein Iba_chr03bCG15140 [Ipomoea batatas]